MMIDSVSKMNVGVKTNTVLVSKNLIQAQFRCLECQKVFISYTHLEEHTVRRHHELLINFHGPAVKGHHEAFSENDRKLSEVAERLENVLSRLETKTTEPMDNRVSTAWVDLPSCASPDNFDSGQNIQVFPAYISDTRKSLSLFTLPYNRRLDPAFEAFGTDDAELCHVSVKDQYVEIDVGSEDRDAAVIPKLEVMADEVDGTNSNHSDAVDDNEKKSNFVQDCALQITSDIRSDHIEATEPLRQLIVDLIKKLEQVSFEPKTVVIEPKQVVVDQKQLEDTYCQTSDIEKDGNAQTPKKTILRKSVTFSKSPITINEEEDSMSTHTESAENLKGQELTNSANSICSLDSSSSDSPEIQIGTHVADEDSDETPKPEEELPNSFGHDECWYGDENECKSNVLVRFPSSVDRPKIQIGTHVADEDSDETSKPEEELPNSFGHDECWDGDENECKSKVLVRFPNFEEESDENNYPKPEKVKEVFEVTVVDKPQCPQNSITFAQTKQKILDLVGKCIKDCTSDSGNASGRKKGKLNVCNEISTAVGVPRDQMNTLLCDHGTLSNIPRDEDSKINQDYSRHDALDEPKMSKNTVCVKNGTPLTYLGMVAPSSVICKDHGMDIDDMSGTSYEQFMKRFSSDFFKNREIIKEQINLISLPRKTSGESVTVQAVSLPKPEPILKSSQAPNDQTRDAQVLQSSPKLISNTNIPRAMELKKTEYAVLLHHETSEVQNVIDTLINDVQRWKNARKDELSKAIKVELQERLASNLNFLGIQSGAKTLSDTAMNSAKVLLGTRRSKAVKGSKVTYFDTLKIAFETEIDRIAKSRTDFPF